jgi:hypothetical protein
MTSLLLLWLSLALALPFEGEEMGWELRYLGVLAGAASARAEAVPSAPGQLLISGEAQTAPWYEQIYRLHDRVVSTCLPGQRSLRYQTSFREGNFHQDQDMWLDPLGFRVHVGQRLKEGWKEWDKSYPGREGVEDPVSALYRMRLLRGEGPWRFPVFSGDRTWTLQVRPLGRERLEETAMGPVDTLLVELETAHKGEIEQRGRFLVWMTEESARVPVRAEVRANIGTIRADLVRFIRARAAYPP